MKWNVLPRTARMSKVIFLDMDDVCCDFVAAACRVFQADPETITSWDIARHVGVATDYFWAGIAAGGVEFWASLDEKPTFREMYDALCTQGQVVFCSSPTRSPSCVAGKLQWLQHRFGRHFQDYIFTPHKHLLAVPGRYLIDDRLRNLHIWELYGGIPIKFPARHNGGTGFEAPWHLPPS